MFVPNATAVGDGPRIALVLHGIFGSGQNFRTLARRLSAEAPDFRFLLCDLRAHGASMAPPPPHTVHAAAEDLVRLEEALGVRSELVVGHSFGGKVGLAYAALREAAGARLDALWVLDANPGARRDAEGLGSADAERVLGWLETLPWPLASRERFFELAAESGLPRPIAEWLAMNVRRTPDGDYDYRVDLGVVQALLRDYFALDLWHVVEQRLGAPVGFVLGGRSPAVQGADRERLDALARDGKARVVVLPDAGHWVHADDPDGVLHALLPVLADRGGRRGP